MDYSETTGYGKDLLGIAGCDEKHEIIITEIVLLILQMGRNGIYHLLTHEEMIEKTFKVLKDENLYNNENNFNIAPLIVVIEQNNIPISALIDLLKYLISFSDIELQNYLDYMINTTLPYILKGYTSIRWINDLVIKIMSAFENRNVLINMDSGYGKFLFDAEKMNVASKYIGWTINYEEYVIGNYYEEIKCNKRADEFDVEIWASMNPSELHSKVDMIYTAYAFNLKISDNNLFSNWKFHSYTKKYSINMIALMNGIDLLNKNGIIVALVPDGGLFNILDRDIRRYLIEENYLDTIISLPGGIIPSTGIGCSLLIAKKNRELKQNVKMINARDLYERKRRYLEFTEENIEQIFEWYKSDTAYENVIFVNKEEITEQDYNFEFTRYIKRHILENATELGSVTENIFRGYQVTAKELDEIVSLDKNETRYYIVNVSDVQPEGYIVSNLQGLRSDAGERLAKYYLEDGDLIITAKNSVVKTAVYEAEDDKKIILTGNLIVIRLDKNKCDPYYLQAFLNSEDGQNEIKSIQTGTTIKVINPKRLEEMMIPLKVIEDQKEIAALCKKTIQEIQDLKNTLYVKTESLGTIYKR